MPASGTLRIPAGCNKRGGHGRRPNGRVGAFLDLFGGGYVDLAVSELRVPPQRANTIIDFVAVEQFGVTAASNLDASDADVLTELASLVRRR